MSTDGVDKQNQIMGQSVAYRLDGNPTQQCIPQSIVVVEWVVLMGALILFGFLDVILAETSAVPRCGLDHLVVLSVTVSESVSD